MQLSRQPLISIIFKTGSHITEGEIICVFNDIYIYIGMLCLGCILKPVFSYLKLQTEWHFIDEGWTCNYSMQINQ